MEKVETLDIPVIKPSVKIDKKLKKTVKEMTEEEWE